MGAVLEVKNISVGFEKPILENISFSVEQDEIFGIIGVSGAGKTTLLNALVGYCPLDSGSVLYKGISPDKDKKQFKKLIGFSSQKTSFYPELTVIQNLEYFAGLYDVPKKIRDYNIKKVLKLVELEETEKLAKNLSGGMKKRLDIACAIVHRPFLLILDEPTGDMDIILRKKMWKLIKDINKTGTTIVIASHFLSEMEDLCSTIGILSKKSMGFIGSPEKFRKLYPKNTDSLDEIFELHLRNEKD